jgi:hypothetical protein
MRRYVQEGKSEFVTNFTDCMFQLPNLGIATLVPEYLIAGTPNTRPGTVINFGGTLISNAF